MPNCIDCAKDFTPSRTFPLSVICDDCDRAFWAKQWNESRSIDIQARHEEREAHASKAMRDLDALKARGE